MSQFYDMKSSAYLTKNVLKMLLLISNNDLCLQKRDTKEFLNHNIAQEVVLL